MVTDVKVGFIPLVDCAALVVAAERGFAAEQGLRLVLSREPSWAAIRDKVAFGVLDAAHMLAGMPLAMTLGLGGDVHQPMIAPMMLGQGGNAVTVSGDLFAAMSAADPAAMAGPRFGSNRALAAVVAARKAAGLPRLRFATVFPFSTHNYELRHWLAAAGIDPDEDVAITVTPPPRMVEHLSRGLIDGFCVGEPWNQVAVNEGLGHIVVTKADIWPTAPEKVLGLRRDWAEAHADTVAALIRAVADAARWADDPAHRLELAVLLAEPRFVGVDVAALDAALTGRPRLAPEAPPVDLPDYHVFHRAAATYPWLSQAEWLLTQMMRWGQMPPAGGESLATVAAAVFRPDLYAAALASTTHPVPAALRKTEGEHAQPYALATLEGGNLMLPADLLAI